MGAYIAELGALGYAYARDAVGERFTKGTRQITVTHVGPLWSVFVNDYRNGGFVLIARVNGLFDAAAVRGWMASYL